MSFEKITSNELSTNLLEKKNITSTRLIENKNISSTRSNRLIEKTLQENADIIDQGWVERHAKYCYLRGVDKYMELVWRARKYSSTPTRLLAYLVDKELRA